MEIIQRIELPSAHQNKVGHHIFSVNHLVHEGKANNVISTLMMVMQLPKFIQSRLITSIQNLGKSDKNINYLGRIKMYSFEVYFDRKN